MKLTPDYSLHLDHNDMSNLGLPYEIRKAMFRAYYHWIKANKPILEFEFEYPWGEGRINKWLSETEYIK